MSKINDYKQQIKEIKEKERQEIKLNKEKENNLKKINKKKSKELRRSLKFDKKNKKIQDKKDKKQGYISFEVDGKEYKLNKNAIFDFSKKEVKLKHKQSKVSNGEVAVLLLRNSGNTEFKYAKPENGMIVLYGKYYHIMESAPYTIGKKRTPLMIIPEWSFIPFTRDDKTGQTMGISVQEAQTQAIKAMETVEIVRRSDGDVGKSKKKADAKTAILVVIGLIVLIAVGSKFLG